MGIENSLITQFNQLNPLWPLSTESRGLGDDHIRLMKRVIKTTFPLITGSIASTLTEWNYVDGLVSNLQTQIDNPGGTPGVAKCASMYLETGASGPPLSDIVNYDSKVETGGITANLSNGRIIIPGAGLYYVQAKCTIAISGFSNVAGNVAYYDGGNFTDTIRPTTDFTDNTSAQELESHMCGILEATASSYLGLRVNSTLNPITPSRVVFTVVQLGT